jgi:putative transposase
MIRTFRYPLRPTEAQKATMDVYLQRCCQLYNAYLEQRREAYRKQKISISRFDQQKELTELRANNVEFGSVPTTVLRSAIRRVDLAFQAFFRRVKTGEKPGYPRFRSARRYQSFGIGKIPKIENSRIFIPLLGLVKFHEYRPLRGQPLDAWVLRDAYGKWYVYIPSDLGAAPEKRTPITHTGIDVGITHLATFSNGHTIENPRFFNQSANILSRRQQILAKKVRGSNSHRRQKHLVAKVHQHIRNQRLDFVRKVAKNLLSNYDLVTYEELDIPAMVQSNFGKTILDAGWGQFIHSLNCKAEEAGKWAVGVDPRGTTQRCSACNTNVPKKLNVRLHECPSCHLILPRDHNAAINIDALGLSAVEGRCKAPESKVHLGRCRPQSTRVQPISQRADQCL